MAEIKNLNNDELKIQGRLRLKGSDGTLYWGVSANSGKLTWDTGKVDVLGLSGQALSLGSGGTTNRLYINTSGNIGIGTTSPNQKLEVNGTIRVSNGGSDKKLEFLRTGGKTFSIEHDTSRLYFYNSTDATTSLAIANGGNVGIGATSPAAPLHVDGGSAAPVRVVSSTFSGIEAHNTNGTWESFVGTESGGSGNRYNSASSQHTFYNNSTAVMRINSSGNVGIKTTSPETELHVYGNNSGVGRMLMIDQDGTGDATLSFRLTGVREYALGIDNSDGDKFKISNGNAVGSTDYLTIDTTGNVGIGVTNPDRKLKVSGRVQFYDYSGSWATNIAYSNFQVSTLINHSSATSGSSIGSYMKLAAPSTGATGVFSDFRSRAYAENTTVNTDFLVNYFAEYRNYTSTSSVTLDNHAGLWVKSLGVGGSATVTNNFGVYLDVGTNATNNYGVYQIGSSVDNYFQGKVGIGTNSPAEMLDVSGNIKATKLLLGTTSTAYTLYSNGESRINNVVLQKSSNTDYLQKASAAGAFYVRNAVSGQSLYVGANASGGAFNNYMLVSGANNNITFRANNSDRMFIASNGKVGIGTTSPASHIHIGNNDPVIQIGTLNTSTGNAALKMFSKNDGTSNAYTIQYTKGTGADRLDFIDGGGTAKISFNNGGAVGIGTTSPSQKLEVIGNIKAGAGAADNYVQAVYTDGASARLHGYGLFMNRSHSYIRPTSDKDKNLYIGADANTWDAVYFDSNYVIFRTDSGEHMRLDSTGKLGIGTTNPSRAFHISISNNDEVARFTSTQGNDSYIEFTNANTNNPVTIGSVVDNFTVLTGGQRRLTLDSTGNVGIGTAAPDSLLEISSSSGGDFLKMTSTGSGANPIKMIFEKSSSEQGVIEYNRNGDLELYNTDGDGGVLISGSASADPDLYVSHGSNVGIGTVSPAQKLHVEGHILLENNYEIRQKDSGGSQRTILELNSSNDLNIGGSYAGVTKFIGGGSYVERMRIHSDGNIGVNTNNPLAKFQVGPGTSNGGSGTAMIGGNSTGIVNALSLVNTTGNDTGRGVRLSFHNRNSWSATGAIQTIQTNSTDAALVLMTYGSSSLTEKMRITSDGKVGIGTTSPSQKLQVDGGIYSNGEHLYVNSGYGVTAVGDLVFRTYDSSYIERARIKDDGKFGIGINSPDSKVHIEQSKATINTTNLDNGTAVGLHITYPDTTLTGGEGIALAMGMNGRGRSYIANISPTTNKDASDIAFYTETGGVIGEKLRIKETGNVGVGTTSPSQKLHVAGNIKTTGWIGSGSSNYITFDDTNNRIDFYANGVHVARMEADGDLHIKGDVIAFSDIF